MHGLIVLYYRPQKDDRNQLRLAVGGNLTNYPGKVQTPKANINTAKLLFKSVVYTTIERYMCCGIKKKHNNASVHIRIHQNIH